jgi:uncharacterized RDD family membrane protein YckC
MTRRHRVSFVLALGLLVGAVSPARGQSYEQGPRIVRSGFTITIGPGTPQEIYPGPFIQVGGGPVVRIWQDYQLASGREVRGVLVIAGNATIDGHVDGDVVVILGTARLGSTASIDGSLIVVAGDTTIAQGASVRNDLVVIGGGLDTPAGFTPGSEYFVIGAPWLGDGLRAVLPWITRGLLLGRPIVPDLGWIWGVVFVFLIVALAVNVLLHGPVGKVADTLAGRPLGAFVAGLLVLLLTAPVALLLTATVIGLAIVPFLFCAVFVAWIVGRVAVARWIGRRVTRQGDDETPLEGLRSFMIGFVLLVLLYMVPVIGFVVWAIVGVFGLGAASLALMAGLRRERPPAPEPTVPVPPSEPPPTTPLDPVTSPHVAAAALAPEVAAAVPPIVGTDAHAPPAGLASGGAQFTAPAPTSPASDLTLLPRATFLDRLAAFVVDVILVVIAVEATNIVREEGAVLVVLLGYFVAFWAWKGTTIGGIVCNIRVVRVDGAPLRFVDAFVRGLSSILSFVPLGLGCFWILRDPQGQAWHDKIAGTYVVRVPRSWPLP